MSRYWIDVIERHILEDPEDRVVLTEAIVAEDLDTGLTDKVACVVQVRDASGRVVLRFQRAGVE